MGALGATVKRGRNQAAEQTGPQSFASRRSDAGNRTEAAGAAQYSTYAAGQAQHLRPLTPRRVTAPDEEPMRIVLEAQEQDALRANAPRPGST